MKRAHTSGLWALRTSWFTRCFVVPLTLVALFSGCYKWSTPSQSPADFIREEEPSKVRLQLMDGRRLVVKNPSVEGDTISWYVDRGWEGSQLVKIPVGEIQQLEHRRPNKAANVVLITLGGLVVLGVVACTASGGCGEPDPSGLFDGW